VFECERGRERETKKAGRERVRGSRGEKGGRGRCIRERDKRDSEREGERDGEGGGGGDRVKLIASGRGEIEGREGREI
jgi:hypothetical protein